MPLVRIDVRKGKDALERCKAQAQRSNSVPRSQRSLIASKDTRALALFRFGDQCMESGWLPVR
jgi:hypothetical protein